MKRLRMALGLLLLSAYPARAQDTHTLPPSHLHHLALALDALNASTNDLQFERDVADPRFALTAVRRILAQPLLLPPLADRILAASCEADGAPTLMLANEFIDSGVSPNPSSTVFTDTSISETPAAVPPIPDGLTGCGLARALPVLAQAHDRVRRSVRPIDLDDRQWSTTTYLAGLFNLEDHDEARQPIMDLGVPVTVIEQVLKEGLDIDPEPVSLRQLNVLLAVDPLEMARAIRTASVAARDILMASLAHHSWPDTMRRIETERGLILVGTQGNDTYTEQAFLILDPGGNDTYSGRAGTANGLLNEGLSIIIDCDGHDRYRGSGLLAPGSAIFGAVVLLDATGDDVYEASYLGQASALCGGALLDDLGGNDVYRAYGLSQGAAYGGIALLEDRGGRDLYDVGLCGQGFAGVRAIGMLLDHEGNDRFVAGGRIHDWDRNDARYLSLSQGFAIGMRPYAGGGVAALVDLDGNDTYEADVYAQGASYWYSVGMLLDTSGHDTYRMHQYGQGSGIHLSLGLLADFAGNDTYTAAVLAQGNAHDYAVGMLLDHAGNDTYTARQFSQGRAMNNAIGLLIDAEGRDTYFAEQIMNCQGVGDDGNYREYGSIAAIVDLAGSDTFSCEARNNETLIRPNHGAVYDVEP